MRPAPLLLLALGCRPPAPAAPEPDVLDALEAPTFERRVAVRIAELEARVTPAAAPPRREPEEGELRALVDLFLTATGSMHEVPLEEMPRFGDAALEELVALAEAPEEDPAVRNGALHLVSVLGTPAALEAVVEVLEDAPEPWRRRYAAWLLGQVEDDRYLLRMLLPLRYEKDPETVVWLADALARHGNHAGLEGLRAVVAQGGPTAELALARESEIVAAAPGDPADADALQRLWSSEESHALFDHEPSDPLRLATWRRLAELSSERFQLRGVDDARFVLSRTGPWGARLVSEALADDDPYVRLHATQVLERMGARARPVVDALHPLLRDPRTAHAVAEALGAIGAPSSVPYLLAALRPQRAHELRVAAARGLGRLGAPEAAPRLRALVDDLGEPPDLRREAAGALLLCGDDPAGAVLLVDGLEDPLGDPRGCEVLLEAWLEAEAAAGTAGYDEHLAAWRELAGPPALLRREEDTRARLAARAALVRGLLRSDGGEGQASHRGS